ncbi:Phage minor tail protein T [uncultured Mediterranean phage uvMED]|jgi:hypothetical protein|nr:Phage minor tail protein T [uncultured Mediterranean phage uvMED]BAR14794.1 hypothetical protein [uncultured Mediterranean phage uvMED]|tara:strand:- start:1 stop:225 length:225 start_codon:yes stop_codon:yes gene_type:complete
MALGVLPKQNNFDTDLDLTFRFKLARELGMTVAELLASMSTMEYNQWIAFYNWENNQINKARALADAEAKKRKR